MSPITLSPQQNQAINDALYSEAVLITGCAGTGKSTVLKEIFQQARSSGKNISICGTTGIAALNIGGSTLHSFTGIGLGKDPAEKIVKNMFNKTRDRLKNLDTLIVDEISMMDADTFDLVDDVLRKTRRRDEPFGGVRMVLFGDFLQLGPVCPGKQPRYVFESPVWDEYGFHTIHLTEIFRQEDKAFANALNKIRIGKPDKETNDIILSCSATKERMNIFRLDEFTSITPTRLVATNAEADKINSNNLSKIDEEEHIFTATASGDAYRIQGFFKGSKVKESLSLKIGASVMCLTNEFSVQGIVNGSTGIICDISDDGIDVEFDCGYVTINKSFWEVKEDDNILATILQYPLVLSYAISIHKSQGMTIPYLYCDITKTFTEGQVYTALSRAKTLDGLCVRGYDPNKIRVCKKALAFYGL